MTIPQHIPISTFDYLLPEEKIAQYPLEYRDASKLLVYREGNIAEDEFMNFANHVDENSLLVFNNTKVIRARLLFVKDTGAQIEIFCLEPHSPSDYSLNFQQKTEVTWKCLVGNLKRWKEGDLTLVLTDYQKNTRVTAQKIESSGDAWIIRFSWDNPDLNFGEVLEAAGCVPIPPYLNRDAEEIDQTRYQTIYSRHKGSVAAPTAGLHFTATVLDRLHYRDVQTADITLHVGAGTFRPVKDENAAMHPMHTEHFSVTKVIIEKLISFQDKVYAVGTTTLRTLESLYWMGVKLDTNPGEAFHLGQWEPYGMQAGLSFGESMQKINDYMETRELQQIDAGTSIMIVPGYTFRSIKALITNFHQPKSTLLLLISAYVGEDWKKIYQYALANEFRFLSYGDSSILYPRT